MPKTIQPLIRDLLVRNCPFCGSWLINITNTHTACYSVECNACGVEMTGPSFEKESREGAVGKVLDHLSAIRAVVRLWNRRVGETSDCEFRPAYLQCIILYSVGKSFSDLGGVFGLKKSSRHSHVRPGNRAERFDS